VEQHHRRNRKKENVEHVGEISERRNPTQEVIKPADYPIGQSIS